MDWRQIVSLYDLLGRMQPSLIVSLNRAVAVGMLNGPRAARADMCRRLESFEEAAKNYLWALALATNAGERRFLERRLREVNSKERKL